MKRFAKALVVLVVLALCAGPALALDKFEADLTVQKAAMVIKQFMASPDADAARYLLKRARAVVIVPDMVKAGFVIGGKYGHGVMLARTKKGWSAPSFVTIAGATVGFQIGAQSTDLFMFVMNAKGLKALMKDSAKFGVDAAVTAGPVGRDAAASLAATKALADIYSYSRSQGAYAGATLEGSGMEPDLETNKAYYGKAYRPADILLKGKVPVPASARDLIKTLEKFAR
jgi:lipid-binding SYLF domain-containing protein